MSLEQLSYSKRKCRSFDYATHKVPCVSSLRMTIFRLGGNK